MTDPTKLSIEAIREHLADVEREYDRMARSHDQLATDVRRLWDANQALVRALLAVEWTMDNDPDWGGARYCPACDSKKSRAIAPTAPSTQPCGRLASDDLQVQRPVAHGNRCVDLRSAGDTLRFQGIAEEAPVLRGAPGLG